MTEPSSPSFGKFTSKTLSLPRCPTSLQREELETNYFARLEEKNLLNFLDHNLKYALRLLEEPDLLSEEVYKVISLLENVEILAPLALPLDVKFHRQVSEVFDKRVKDDARFGCVVDDFYKRKN